LHQARSQQLWHQASEGYGYAKTAQQRHSSRNATKR